MIEALIFDFDGLILDTEVPIFQSYVELYQEFGCELTLQMWARNLGTHDDDVLDLYDDLEQRLGYALDRQALGRRRLQRELDLVQNQPVLPGVKEYLEEGRARGLKMGIASSSYCRWILQHLERLGLRDYFESIRTGDEIRPTKPDPGLYRAVLADFGISPSQAVAFEDSPKGILAARGAGIFTVAVPNDLTRQLDLGQVDLQLGSLAELPLPELLDLVEAGL